MLMGTSTYVSHRFDLDHRQYLRIRLKGMLFAAGLAICMALGIVAGIVLWRTYPHDFTWYVKWQDALLALSWCVAFVALGGMVLVLRFLYALHAGYTKGMVTLVDGQAITVRDLSPENLKSIFWIMNSTFWCFVVALVGLVPAILLGWTLPIPDLPLRILATTIAFLLSLAGLVVSIVSLSFIVIGCIGGVSFGRKLGSSRTYQLNGQAVVRIDDFVLTIIYPATPESMVDLNLLAPEDQRQLLALLRKRWLDVEQAWNPTLGEEIEEALEAAEAHMAEKQL